ncbi:NYN domain-containing protein [Aurantimonas sp. Leaf443]|uniref:NYN domain-containing protein n=1 Tax=Aurantimonas sp. Leaf443 TaxID=1736378 RepID=UPI0006F2D61D|nr:NYN domain-containing protein [Aurantimonas sp. Leaf443]KQT85962.1 Maebl [Aurantimonas sp. Leaf443]
MSLTKTERTPRLAVLIDADNTSPKIVDGLFEEIAKIGEASVRRIYGDFSSQRSRGWADVLARFAIIPQQQFAYTTGKNASDITLVIDAMDLLHSRRFDGFCLVSSDSDFTRLAARIREEGIDAYGFGEQKTPESFRQACRRFVYTENLMPARATVAGKAEEPVQVGSLLEPDEAVALLRRVIVQMDSEDGWVNLGTFGKQLLNLASDFDPRTYGFRKLSDLVRSTGAYEFDEPEGGAVRIRLKPVEPPRPRAARSSRGGRGKRPAAKAAPAAD